MNPTHKKIVCYILSYYDPDYVRTHTLMGALRRINNIKLISAINKRRCVIRYAETIFKLMYIRLKYNPEIYFLGFRGHEIFWLVRLITTGKYLIFDSFVSPYDALYGERKYGITGRFFGKIIFPFEKNILHHADLLLTDTQLHKQFFIERFNLSANKIKVIPVGAREEYLIPSYKLSPDKEFKLLFYGSCLPLHGLNIILEAIQLVMHLPIAVILIGGNKFTFKKIQEFQLTQHPPNFQHLRWVDFETLCQQYLAQADLVLGGPFGGTGQARRVISGKTIQSLAMGKATIIGKIEQETGFVDKHNCLLVDQNNPQQLADAICWGVHNRHKLIAIGRAGQQLYNQRFSIEHITEELVKIL